MPENDAARIWKAILVVGLAIATTLLALVLMGLFAAAVPETKLASLLAYGALVVLRLVLAFWLAGLVARLALRRWPETTQALATRLAFVAGATVLLSAIVTSAITHRFDEDADMAEQAIAEGRGDNSDAQTVAMRPDAWEHASDSALFVAILPAAFAAFVGVGGLRGRRR